MGERLFEMAAEYLGKLQEMEELALGDSAMCNEAKV
jgi:hypothetical protein